jgi:23S rRNA (cytidine1920-2'-O)/16S rRNA (cytidine1409-2'-O)-methyltransferase
MNAASRRERQRADLLVVEQGLADSRARAQALILAGQVWNGAERVDKPGSLLPTATRLRAALGPRFVSRGGEKLEHGLEAFAAAGLRVAGTICVDIGAATGGFTDCLLQRGAARVHAVDVGYGQLHPRLRADPRVVVRERVNARTLAATDFADRIDLVVVDASFISLGKLLAAIAAVLRPGGELVALIKPQFEAGRVEASRGRGVIRDERVREHAIAAGRDAVLAAGFEVVAETDSPIRGPKGNLERLLYARRGGG